MVEVWGRVLAYTGVQDKRLTGRVSQTRILCTDPCSFSIPLATDRDTQSDAGSGRSACAVWECLEEQGCAALAGCRHYVLAVT